MVTQNVNLDLVPPRFGRSNVTVSCSQYDKDFRVINFSIFNKNVLFNIPSGSVVTIRGTKPQDNTGFEYQCSFSGNLVTFPIQDQVTVYSGEIPAELRITKDGKIIGSANFNFLVEPSPLLNETVVSETDLPLLQEALNAVDDVLAYRNEAEASALDSEAWAVGERDGEAVEDTDPTYHNNSKYYAEQSATSESNAQQYSLDALGYKNDAKDYRDDALSYKNLAEGYKNDAYDYKELAKGYKDDAYASEVNAKASEDNAKDYKDLAEGYKNDAKTYRDEAYGFKNDASGYSSDALGYKNEAKGYRDDAYSYKTDANTYKGEAKGYRDEAYGFKNEASQSKTDAKSYRDDALQYKNDASGYKDDASASATSSSNSALKSEGFAVGQQNGTDVTSGSPYYENNAKYYSEEAEESYNSTLALTGTFAQKDGVYPKLIAGGIIESEVKDEEFTYQSTEHTGIANLNSIKGNTLVWNQLVANDTTSVTLTSGHIFVTIINGTFTRVNGTGHSVSVTGGTDNVFDLTKMFGSGNEPTLDQFRFLYSLSYYKNNTGSLLSFTGTGIKVTGFNQWDGEWEVGNISNITGEDSSNSSRIRSVGYIPVFPNTTYYVKAPSGKSVGLRYYDASKTFISASSVNNDARTTPSNCHYLRFTVVDYSAYVEGDICINISSSKNGTYEPYTTSTLSLPISTYFPTGMKSAGSGANRVYDELTEEKVITRVGTRAYASGDESDTTVTTDGTNTNYALTTPTEVDVDLDLTYRTYEGGTEQLLPINTDEPTTSPISVNVEFDFDENLNARIEKMLGCLAQVETSPTTHAYSSGDYLMYNYQLYKVTSSISVGGTLTVGTNITATTVMSELISLTA